MKVSSPGPTGKVLPLLSAERADAPVPAPRRTFLQVTGAGSFLCSSSPLALGGLQPLGECPF